MIQEKEFVILYVLITSIITFYGGFGMYYCIFSNAIILIFLIWILLQNNSVKPRKKKVILNK
jgi:hypothetical protein